MHNKKGFTLIELLVVVLIIAILAAVALPMYKRSVAKSRLTTAIPVAKAVANAQEVYFMNENAYATDQEQLDITVPSEAAQTNATISTEDDYKFVLVYNKDFPNAHYIIYQQHSKNFPGNIHCEAKEDDSVANWVCEKGLGEGTRTDKGSVTDNFITYIIEGSESDGKFAGGEVFYNQRNLTLTGKDSCIGTTSGGCANGEYHNQSFCSSEALVGSSSQSSSHACGGGTFYDKSSCLGKDYNGCGSGKFYGDSSCSATSRFGCGSNDNSHFYDNSTCEGLATDGCRENFHDNSSCNALVYASCQGKFYDNASCDASTGLYGCRDSKFYGSSSCTAATRQGCEGSFYDNSSCTGTGESGCHGNFYNNSYCVATAEGVCPGAGGRYHDSSYCVGAYCAAGTPREDGSIRTEMGE